MSKLTNSLKKKIDFNHRVTLYIPKSLIEPHKVKALKDFHGQKNPSNALKLSIEFYVFSEINKDKDLFKQLEYSHKFETILEQMKNTEYSYQSSLVNKEFYKLSVLYWHFIFCISKTYHIDNIYNSNDIVPLINRIVNYNYESYLKIFPEKGEYFA